MKRFIKRKAIPLLLALTIILSVLPVGSVAAESEEADPYASYADAVGSVAMLRECYIDFYVCADPDNVTDYTALSWTGAVEYSLNDLEWDTDEEYEAVYQQFYSLQMVITDYRIVEQEIEGWEEPLVALWYKVEAAEGYTLPEMLQNNPWIFQNFLDDFMHEFGRDALTIFKDVAVAGLPDGVEVNWEEVSAEKVETVWNSIVITNNITNSSGAKFFGSGIVPAYEDDTVYQPIEDDTSVTVYIADVWDDQWVFPIVDVYHILENPTAIEAAEAAGTLLKSTDADLTEAYSDLYAQYGYVPYELISTRNGLVTLWDGGITFEASSFSDYYVSSSDGAAVTISAPNNQTSGVTGNGNQNNPLAITHTVYTVAGTTASITIADDTVVKTGSNTDNISLGDGSVSDSNTVYSLAVGDNASSEETTNYTFTWDAQVRGRGRTEQRYYKVTVTVVVYSQEDFEKNFNEYLANAYESSSQKVNHIQIDVESEAIIDGAVSSLDFGLLNEQGTSNGTTVTVEKVIDTDDTVVGYYYKMTYQVTVDGTTRDVVITLRIEDQDYYPDDVSLSFSLYGLDSNGAYTGKLQNNSGNSVSTSYPVTIKEQQISFNGQFSVGVNGYPVVYKISVEVTDTDADGNKSITTVSDSIGYWDDDNECPGASETVGNSAGIDISKFSLGMEYNGKTYFVLYSDLTKEVKNYTFGAAGNLSERTYIFGIYRKAKSEGDWVLIDTLTVSVGADGKTTTDFTPEATNYLSIGDLSPEQVLQQYDFKIEELAYKISGYKCDIVFSGVEDGNQLSWNATTTTVTKATSTNNSNTVVSTLTVKTVSDFGANIGTTTIIIETGSNKVTYTGESTTSTDGNTTTTTITDNTNGTIVLTVTSNNGTTTTTVTVGNQEVYKIASSGSSNSYTITDNATGSTTSQTVNIEEITTIVFDTQITCTNTYSIAGLDISKNFVNASESDKATEFTVKITPSAVIGDDGDNMTAATFNNKSFTYAVNGSIQSDKLTVTSSNSGYGTITFKIKANQTFTIQGLPDGTYTVEEVFDQAAVPSGCIYDSTKYTVTIVDGEISVDNQTTTDVKETATSITFVNKRNTVSLTITKEGCDAADADQAFIFYIKGEDTNTEDIDLTVVLHGNGTITITDLPVGQYTVTEDENWSWRYEVKEVKVNDNPVSEADGVVTVELSGAGTTVVYVNNRTEDQWLDGNSSAENIFTGTNGTTEGGA